MPPAESASDAAPRAGDEGAERSPLITVDALRARLGDPSLRLVDARFDLADPDAGRRAFVAARLPGARYAHLDDDLSDHARAALEGRHPLPHPDRFAAALARWRITPATPVVVYDSGSSAMAAARAWWLLRWMGHAEVRVLDGGFAAWAAAGASLDGSAPDAMPGGETRRSAQADGWRAGRAPTADADAVAARAASVVLVDARTRERFRGDVEPLDPRAGHIPGALNRPFTDNLEAGRFKPAAMLRDEWRALLRDGTTAMLSCGSGVTACHHALALLHAGWPMPVLFAASWSGWSRDPSRPIATGD